MIDTLYLFILIGLFFKGVWQGDHREVIVLISWIFCVGVSWFFTPTLANKLDVPEIPRVIIEVFSFFIIALAIFTPSYLVKNRFARELSGHTRLKNAERILGGAFALFRGWVLLVGVSTVCRMLPIDSTAMDQSFLLNAFSLA